MMPELTPQRLKLLREIVPTLSRVAILWRPGTLSQDTLGQMLNETQATARSLGVQIQIVEAEKVDDFNDAFAAMRPLVARLGRQARRPRRLLSGVDPPPG
jgi:hypothetical protein